MDQHPYLRGFAVNDRDEMYVADTGDARCWKSGLLETSARC